jgi:hypothetical protein
LAHINNIQQNLLYDPDDLDMEPGSATIHWFATGSDGAIVFCLARVVRWWSMVAVGVAIQPRYIYI